VCGLARLWGYRGVGVGVGVDRCVPCMHAFHLTRPRLRSIFTPKASVSSSEVQHLCMFCRSKGTVTTWLSGRIMITRCLSNSLSSALQYEHLCSHDRVHLGSRSDRPSARCKTALTPSQLNSLSYRAALPGLASMSRHWMRVSIF